MKLDVKTTKTLFLTIVMMFQASWLSAVEEKSKPNIILIFADDLGWKDVGYQGSDFMETPVLDAMAKEGMVFTNAYAAAGNCAPSRACMLSGNYTPRHGVYAVGTTERGPKSEMRLVPVPNKSGLAKENVTFADAMKSAGYVTGIFGKWHLEGKDGARAEEQGFDVVNQCHGGWNGKETDNPNGIYSLTQAAGEFMEKNKDRPFFVYLPHYAIHTGLQSRKSTLEKFEAKKPGKQHHDALYAACTYDLDDGIGLLLKKLKELGLDQNTMVIFTSDNGGTQQSSQEPLRGNKGGYYEGGIREPMIVRWPGVVKAGTTCDVPVINVDFFPTLLAAAGAKPEKDIDGESLLPLLKQEGPLKRESIFWHFPGYLDDPVTRGRELDVRTGFRSRPVSVIRKGDWKLHLFTEEWQLDGGREKLATNNAVELYNIRDDIGERKNLAADNMVKRDELLDELLEWFKSTDAILPAQPNPAYDPGNAGAAKDKKVKKKSK